MVTAWTDIKKVIEMGPHMLGTMAGGAADNQFWLRLVQKEARFDTKDLIVSPTNISIVPQDWTNLFVWVWLYSTFLDDLVLA